MWNKYGRAAIRHVTNAQITVFIPPKDAYCTTISDDNAMFRTASYRADAAIIVHTGGQ
jgi:hypothetical protein